MDQNAPLLNTGGDTSGSGDIAPPTGPVSYSATDDSTTFETIGIRSTNSRKEPCLVYLLTFMACIGGFLFGYDTGVVSGAMIFIRTQFHLDSLWHELIVSTTIGAAALFAVIGGFSNEKLGRKKTIIAASLLFIIGSLVLGAAWSKVTLLIGRFIVGAGPGVASSTVPIYIAEATPALFRGRLVTTYNLAITFGQFFASLVDGIFSWDRVNGWRYMMGLAALPALVQFIGFWFMPESPRWLIAQQRHEAAKQVLSRLVPADELEAELEAIQFSVLDQQKERDKLGGRNIFVQMLSDQSVRKALVLGCGLQLFQQLCGINTVMYYSASIIQMSGVANDEAAVWLAALVAFINFIFTFVGIAMVDRVGRRPLMLASMAGVVGSLMFLAVSFMVVARFSPAITVHEGLKTSSCYSFDRCDPCVTSSACGFCYVEHESSVWNGSCVSVNPKNDHLASSGRCAAKTDNFAFLNSYCPTSYGVMAVIGLGIYLACFAPGMGPMPWTINSEIYPLWARSAGAAAATAVNWMANLVISMTFLTLTETITKAGTFWLYTIISLLGFIFVFKMLPETKGKALEDIHALFEKPWCSEGKCDVNCKPNRNDFEELNN